MMTALSDLQRRFAAALVDSNLDAPGGSSRRFGVHRNNVRSGMTGVLQARFPVVRRLVGEEFFHGMAQLFIAQQPPISPILMLYGAGFPGFIAGLEPAGDVPYLADVARLEWLQHETMNAADAAAIGASQLAAVPAEAAAGLRLRLHPSLRLFESDYPALTIWELNVSPGEVVARRLEAEPEYALMLRPKLSVEIRRVPVAFHTMVATLRDGATLTAAFEAAAAQDGLFDLEHSLTGLITMGAVIGYDVGPGDQGVS